MDATKHHMPDRKLRRAVTLIELLTVIVIVSILMAMLLPALNAARERSRESACHSNLRQFGIGLAAHASTHGTYCSGAFDFVREGAVTEVGWVADLVSSGTQVGKMLCPSNDALAADTFNDLCDLTFAGTPIPAVEPCVDRRGSQPQTRPDGSLSTNPCRQILDPATPLAARLAIVESQILKKTYNTNYTASWLLVCTGYRLGPDGNVTSSVSGGTTFYREGNYEMPSRGATIGPLKPAMIDAGKVAGSSVPLLGCGAPMGTLAQSLNSDYPAGTPTVAAITRGPVLAVDAAAGFKENLADPGDTVLERPEFRYGSGAPADKRSIWWDVWKWSPDKIGEQIGALQDYRRFGPVHRGACGVLFADGSVRAIRDTNKDGVLNSGFVVAQPNPFGFADSTVELDEMDVFTGCWLKSP